MFAVPVLLLLLTSNDPASDEARARAELEVCAARIEELKARHEFGAELHRLLRRSQELAGQLEHTGAAEGSRDEVEATPSAEELRERADAARDEVDRLAADIAALDVRIADARRGQADGVTVARAALGPAAVHPLGPGDRVRRLLAERTALSERRRQAEGEAARLEAAARAADRAELERSPP
jgi:hypothetical protein